MSALILALIEQLARKYSDVLLDEGMELLRKVLLGKASNAEILDYIVKIQDAEQKTGPIT